MASLALLLPKNPELGIYILPACLEISSAFSPDLSWSVISISLALQLFQPPLDLDQPLLVILVPLLGQFGLPASP